MIKKYIEKFGNLCPECKEEMIFSTDELAHVDDLFCVEDHTEISFNFFSKTPHLKIDVFDAKNKIVMWYLSMTKKIIIWYSNNSKEKTTPIILENMSLDDLGQFLLPGKQLAEKLDGLKLLL
jgi:hypothetical protein